VLLLLAIAVTSALQLGLAGTGLVRWAAYSVLIPPLAAALLPLRETAIIGALALAGVVVIYGVVIDDISRGGRIVVVMSVVLAYVLGLITCRVRLNRERRMRGLMVARERLTLLTTASSRVGSTLDVTRTANELADVAVPGFADFVTVDLFEPVLRGEEPPSGPFSGAVRLCRVAQRSVLHGTPESVVDLGRTETYPEISIPARSLAAGAPIKAAFAHDALVAAWLAGDDVRAERSRAYGFHSWITVPLGARGATLGLVAFVRHKHPDPFDADDVILAEEVAARAAVCLDNARRYTGEHATSLTLQRSLLPRRLRAHAAVEVAGRYLPAGLSSGVGGDWFDVIPLSSARVALVVGDVVGHGLYASAAMGRLRTAVRTLADIDLPPDELLTHLDDVVLRLGGDSDQEEDGEWVDHAGRGSAESGEGHGAAGAEAEAQGEAEGQRGDGLAEDTGAGMRNAAEDLPAEGPGGLTGELRATGRAAEETGGAASDIGATCLYAVYDPVSRRATLARAGHPLPALVTPEGRVEFVDMPAGPPLGLGGLPFESVEVDLPEGSVLALYTDGLVESRRHDVDEGLRKLAESLARPGLGLEALCDTVLKELVDDRPEDDVALLVARTQVLDAGHVAAWDLPSDPSAVADARALATAQVTAWGLGEATFTTELVVSELVTNAIRHAAGPIQLRIIREKSLICEVSDGTGTSPHLRRARSFDEGGRGLFIVASVTDHWGTRQNPAGKTIWADIPLPEPA
jgi:serine phosphatase RsbU (regulator of sigma subunit)/anti-sigma regulatory factor (Ser/Thr protein kinase)